MPQMPDHYAILGVAQDATQEVIKTAYRKLARKLHPDVNKAKDAHKRFSDLSEAHEVLGDPARRADYDALRARGWGEDQQATQRPRGSRRAEVDEDAYADVFSSFFGAHGRSAPRTGGDLHHIIELSLAEVYGGGERDLRLQVPGGDGTETRTLHVTIPKGLAEGEQIRLRGQGRPGAAPALAGDLYLEAAILPHAFYRVEGRNILLDLPLTPWEAVLGAQVAVPTLGGPTTVTIPAGAQAGQRLRLRGRGLPGSPAGDQVLTLAIASPVGANDHAKTLWRELAAASPFNPRTALGV